MQADQNNNKFHQKESELIAGAIAELINIIGVLFIVTGILTFICGVILCFRMYGFDLVATIIIFINILLVSMFNYFIGKILMLVRKYIISKLIEKNRADRSV